jgi:hypothetical protein
MASSIASSYDSSYISGSCSRPSTARPSTSGPSTARPGTAHTVRPRTARPRTAVSQIGGPQQIICAVTESRGVSATVGLCFVNLTTGKPLFFQSLENLADHKPKIYSRVSSQRNPRLPNLCANHPQAHRLRPQRSSLPSFTSIGSINC